jgi:hypothetical protein
LTVADLRFEDVMLSVVRGKTDQDAARLAS